MVKFNVCPLLVPLLAGSPESWIVSGVFWAAVALVGLAVGLRGRASDAAFGLATTVTWNDCCAVVLVVGSLAVTVIVEVSPTRAWVVSIWATPLGFVVERVAEVMVT